MTDSAFCKRLSFIHLTINNCGVRCLQEEIRNSIDSLLERHGLCPAGAWTCEQSGGDGSDRLFFRIRGVGGEKFMAVLPAANAAHGMREALAAYHLGSHFQACGAAVPEIYAFDAANGLLVFEDLGETLLHGFISSQDGITELVLSRYFEAVEKLAHLQIVCRHGFETRHCWDTPRYDENVMTARESGYFYNAFCQKLLGFGEMSAALHREFTKLAQRASLEPADYVLHRDFQSRNLMLGKGGVRIIDFQAARLGPLAYDLASLLIDPYAALPEEYRQQILLHYVEAVRAHISLDLGSFVEGYYFMALQRNLQILGAFSYLSRQKGKSFFKQFIGPAAEHLHGLLAEGQGSSFPVLAGLTEQIISRIQAGVLEQTP